MGYNPCREANLSLSSQEVPQSLSIAMFFTLYTNAVSSFHPKTDQHNPPSPMQILKLT